MRKVNSVKDPIAHISKSYLSVNRRVPRTGKIKVDKKVFNGVNLSPRQKEVYSFLWNYLKKNGRAPLLREIQNECHIRSHASVINILLVLEHKGLIRRIPHKRRGIILQYRNLDNVKY